MVREKLHPRPEHDEDVAGGKKLILHNDDIHSFDYVIEALVEVCDHEPEQAEQCAMIAHFKGKCPVRSGSTIELKPYLHTLTGKGLTVTID